MPPASDDRPTASDEHRIMIKKIILIKITIIIIIIINGDGRAWLRLDVSSVRRAERASGLSTTRAE